MRSLNSDPISLHRYCVAYLNRSVTSRSKIRIGPEQSDYRIDAPQQLRTDIELLEMSRNVDKKLDIHDSCPN